MRMSQPMRIVGQSSNGVGTIPAGAPVPSSIVGDLVNEPISEKKSIQKKIIVKK